MVSLRSTAATDNVNPSVRVLDPGREGGIFTFSLMYTIWLSMAKPSVDGSRVLRAAGRTKRISAGAPAEQREGSQAWPTATDSRSVPEGVRAFKSPPSHFRAEAGPPGSPFPA